MRLIRVLIGVTVASLAGLAAAGPARAEVPSGPCALTGFAPHGAREASQTRKDAAARRVEELVGGTNLAGRREWQVPDGSRPVVVVDSAQPLNTGHADLFVFGLRFRLADGSGAPRTHYVSDIDAPALGVWTRRVGLSAAGGPCRGELVLSVSRAPYTTVAGAGGFVLTVLGLAGAVLLARRRRGGWTRRFLVAAPVALLAGFGEALLLHETGVLSPFSARFWWLPGAGLLLVAVLPLTRAGRSTVEGGAQPTATAAAGEPVAVEPVAVGPVTFEPVALPVSAGASGAVGRPLTAAIAAALLIGALGVVLALRPTPADAATEAVTPVGARLIFSSIWADAKAKRYDHLEGVAKLFGGGILDSVAGFRENAVTNLGVGVPAQQHDFPAYFVATGDTAINDGRTLHFYCLIARDAAERPWSMVEFRVAPSADYVPRPKILPDGHLAPVPAVADLAIGPMTISQRYADWYNRSALARAVAPDDALEMLGTGSSATLVKMATTQSGAHAEGGALPVFRQYSAQPAKVRPELVPLVDGGVVVSFSVAAHLELFNNDRPVTRACSVEWLRLDDTDPAHYSHTRYDAPIYPVAYVPLRSTGKRTVLQDNASGEWKGTGELC